MRCRPVLVWRRSSIDVEQLEGHDPALLARAQQRQISYDQARQYRALARVADLYIEESTDFDLCEFAAAETGAALTLTRSGGRSGDGVRQRRSGTRCCCRLWRPAWSIWPRNVR